MRVVDLANWIIGFSIWEKKEKSLLKLHKITYFIIADYLREYGKMLVSDFDFFVTKAKYIESKSIKDRFWRFGANPITVNDPISCIIPNAQFIVKRLKIYLNLKPWELVRMQSNTKAYMCSMGSKKEIKIEDWMMVEDFRI